MSEDSQCRLANNIIPVKNTALNKNCLPDILQYNIKTTYTNKNKMMFDICNSRKEQQIKEYETK